MSGVPSYPPRGCSSFPMFETPVGPFLPMKSQKILHLVLNHRANWLIQADHVAQVITVFRKLHSLGHSTQGPLPSLHPPAPNHMYLQGLGG